MSAGRRRAYSSYRAMIRRCSDPADDSFRWYGGRGVTVCDPWRESFGAFIADVGERPEGTSLDRIDPEGNYEPGNVRWATATEQRLNRRDRPEPPPRIRQAASHVRYHESRLDELPLKWLSVGNPPRLVEDDCLRCDERGPVTEDGFCGGCARPA
jgi:hypothetical protein